MDLSNIYEWKNGVPILHGCNQNLIFLIQRNYIRSSLMNKLDHFNYNLNYSVIKNVILAANTEDCTGEVIVYNTTDYIKSMMSEDAFKADILKVYDI